MKTKAFKIALTFVVLSAALGGLMYTTLAEGTEYYKHVDEVMAQPADWYGKKLQLHGYVVPGSVLQRKNSLEYKFKVQSNGHIVDATYIGVVPDTFKGEAEVVLKGTLAPDGLFTVSPNGVMAKCPSKYEAKPGTAGAARPGI
jgi:cytochrome c-type biogenesis protein CcmE